MAQMDLVLVEGFYNKHRQFYLFSDILLEVKILTSIFATEPHYIIKRVLSLDGMIVADDPTCILN